MGRKQIHEPYSMPAPLGGLNVRDALQSMPSNDAVTLVNWIPQQYGVRCRKGYYEWATNMALPIQTVMAYSPSRTNPLGYKMFANTDANIYDITSTSNAPPVSLALAGVPESGRFSWLMMANAAGTFLLTCSHEGGYRYYDGAAWTVTTLGAGAGQVSNIDPALFCFCTTWKRRAWFIEKGTTSAWYLAANAISGPATEFDFGPLMPNGGALAFLASWTIDAGEGVDDFFVVAGENGDILIYKGTDPSSAATFALQGRFYLGRLPLGRRGFVTLGGDLLILSETGIQPISYVTRGGQSLLRAGSVDYLGKIQPLIVDLMANNINTIGWELTYSQRDNLMVVKIPNGVTNQNVQYALYTATNKWFQIAGYPMTTSSSTPTGYFFGDSAGVVHQGFSGFFDGVLFGASEGNGIVGAIQPAYSYFGMPGVNKQWHMVRGTFLSTDIPSVGVSMIADYSSTNSPGIPAYTSFSGATWDVSQWDVAKWGGALVSFKDWASVEACGFVGSAYFATVCVGDTFLVSIDYIFEPGGPL